MTEVCAICDIGGCRHIRAKAAKTDDGNRLEGIGRYDPLVEQIRQGFAEAELSGSPVRHDPVNHPYHYTSSPARCECGRGVECIQITEHMGFCLGNALKYIWRADLKGNAVEDLEKARFYIDREIARRAGKGE